MLGLRHLVKPTVLVSCLDLSSVFSQPVHQTHIVDQNYWETSQVPDSVSAHVAEAFERPPFQLCVEVSGSVAMSLVVVVVAAAGYAKVDVLYQVVGHPRY